MGGQAFCPCVAALKFIHDAAMNSFQTYNQEKNYCGCRSALLKRNWYYFVI